MKSAEAAFEPALVAVGARFKCEQPRQQLAEQVTRIADQATRTAELAVSSAPRLEITCHFQVSLAVLVKDGHSWRDSDLSVWG